MGWRYRDDIQQITLYKVNQFVSPSGQFSSEDSTELLQLMQVSNTAKKQSPSWGKG